MSKRPRFLRLLSCLLAALLLAPASAQETPPAADQKAADQKPADDQPADPDRYKVPETEDVAELQKFVQGLLSFQPTSRAEALEHRTKRLPAIEGACEKILQLEKDTKSESYRMARSFLVQIQAGQARRMTREQKQALVDDVVAFVESAGAQASGYELSASMALAQAMEAFDQKKLAAQVYARAGEALAKSEEPQVAQNAQIMVGAGRRLSLPGNEIVIQGTRYNGQPFNISELRGKVVLVDFWATWCGPCVAEIPNMKANYERFHPQGFEIVGISLDQNREALDSFLDEKELPWIVLHEKDGDNPAAKYYGIMGIPAMFLVDKDGKVISTQARGEELTKLLETQFESDETSTEDQP